MQRHADREQFFEFEDKPVHEVRVIRPEDLWWNCPKCWKRIQAMYDHCVYCNEARPERTKPIEVEPVRPKPPSVPEPKPETPVEEPAKPSDWKKQFHWIATVASVILNAWFFISLAVPAPIASIVKMVLLSLKEIFQ